MLHDLHLYALTGVEEIQRFMEGAYLEKDYSIKVPDLPWPADYYAREEELENRVFIVEFDDWSINVTASRKKVESDKLARHKSTLEKVKKVRNRQLKQLILYLYCKNILFQMAFLYYQFDDLGYKPPHRAYFKVMTILFMRIWAYVEH